jgi:hypothetical protein
VHIATHSTHILDIRLLHIRQIVGVHAFGLVRPLHLLREVGHRELQNAARSQAREENGAQRGLEFV